MSFRDLRVGDRVTRVLGGAPMVMEIVDVCEDVVVCAAVREDGSLFRGDWTFCRDTGAEEDEELGWGRAHGVTGSFLVRTR